MNWKKQLRPLVPVWRFFRSFGMDPLRFVASARAFPHFLANLRTYHAQCADESRFRPKSRDLHFTTFDRFLKAADTSNHYFWQDLWAADFLYRQGVREHVDIASRVDGFVAHLLPFCKVTYVDLRPLAAEWPHLRCVQGSILQLPFADKTVNSLSCLHVLEHIGLGRYGDPVDPDSHQKAAAELGRVLAVGGTLLIGVPVGRERVCFDAHRVFDPATIETLFAPLRLQEFHLIPDKADRVILGAGFEEARKNEFGCGLFVFQRMAEPLTPEAS